ncbi:protein MICRORCHIDIA 7-like [Papaver somniferum]|uniref:protein MICRORCHIDIA 7-like n=1 Tax=Papaver somniferum TaxID=3469 RepID=UPI000E6FBC84|nr:protein MICRORCHIDIA 7-like [Papaver somniferum]
MENKFEGVNSDSTSSSSSSNCGFKVKRSRGNEEDEVSFKKAKFVLPEGFLEPLDDQEILAPLPLSVRMPDSGKTIQFSVPPLPYSKQFWKAGDYEDIASTRRGGGATTLIEGMDHVRVHPRFLHSNATSHKWVLGAVAELLDNSIDEVSNGATYCNIDVRLNKKDGSRMLVVEDNGGGMSPERMRHCMSLGYSAKSKLANTIGQYGNGFKTSTMRCGADVIVFSRCPGKDGRSATQSIGLLSYTFLTSTGKEDIVVPMLDYQWEGNQWSRISSPSVDSKKNVETIVQWSPYVSEADLLQQFNLIKDQGTRIIIYNLWQDEAGDLELDFESDVHDIQIRGVDRDEKKIQMAKDYPNSRIFLTYTHSLRSYSSILYLRRPPGFRIILRGKDVVHHNLVDDMIKKKDVNYKPTGVDSAEVNANKGVLGKMGFHKDAEAHLDIQGFNVYHRNRLIKAFWRVWNAASSGGRGVIGQLEANFVKPAHDKQDFERTVVLSRLETKLMNLQKSYWNENKRYIGYVDLKVNDTPVKGKSPTRPDLSNSNSPAKEIPTPDMEKCNTQAKRETQRSMNNMGTRTVENGKEPVVNHKEKPVEQNLAKNVIYAKESGVCQMEKPVVQNLAAKRNEEVADSGTTYVDNNRKRKNREEHTSEPSDMNCKRVSARVPEDQIKVPPQAYAALVRELQVENRELKERIKELEEKHQEKCRSLEAQLAESKEKFEELNKEQEALIEIFAEERTRRDAAEENFKNKLKDASKTIHELQDKLSSFEKNQ